MVLGEYARVDDFSVGGAVKGIGFSQYGEMGVAACLGGAGRIETHPEVIEVARKALGRAGAATGLMEWYSERLEIAPGCPSRGPHNHIYFTAPLLATDAPGRLVEAGARE